MQSERSVSETDDIVQTKRKTGFISDVLAMAFGTGFAQVLAVFVYPVVTRLYSPDDFGVSALFLSIASIIVIIASLRYEISIMLPKSDEEAANLFALSVFLVGVTSALTSVFFWFYSEEIANSLNASGLGTYLPFISISVFVGGIFFIMTYWNSRVQQFRRISFARISSSLTISGTQLGAGFAGFASGGSLIGANILGNTVSAVVLGYHIWRDDMSRLRGFISWKSMIAGFKRYINFPLYDAGSSLLNVVYLQLPIVALSRFFTTTIVGYYSLSMMVLQLPMNLVGSAIAQVFFQRAANAKHENPDMVANLARSALLRLSMVGTFPLLILMLIGKEAFTVIFGLAWAEAGIYSQILSGWILIMFITSPISPLFAIFEKQKYTLLFNVFNLIIRGGALVAGGILGDARTTVAFVAIAGIISYTLSNLWLLHIVGVSIWSVLTGMSRYLIISIPLWCIVAAVKWIIFPSSVVLIVLSALAVLMYFALIIWQEKELQLIILATLQRLYVLRGSG